MVQGAKRCLKLKRIGHQLALDLAWRKDVEYLLGRGLDSLWMESIPQNSIGWVAGTAKGRIPIAFFFHMYCIATAFWEWRSRYHPLAPLAPLASQPLASDAVASPCTGLIGLASCICASSMQCPSAYRYDLGKGSLPIFLKVVACSPVSRSLDASSEDVAR